MLKQFEVLVSSENLLKLFDAKENTTALYIATTSSISIIIMGFNLKS